MGYATTIASASPITFCRSECSCARRRVDMRQDWTAKWTSDRVKTRLRSGSRSKFVIF